MIDHLLIVSGLEKVFLDERPAEYSGKFSMLRKDQLSFQIAFYMNTPGGNKAWPNVRVKVYFPL